MKNLHRIVYRVALIVLSASALSTAAFAQEIEWERFYSQEYPLPVSGTYYSGRHILPMADGGYLVTSVTGGSTVAVTRLDGAGNRMWERIITDTQSNIYGELGWDEPVKIYPRFSYVRDDGQIVLFGNEGGVPDAVVDYGSVYQLVLNEKTGEPLDTITGFADTVGRVRNGSAVCRLREGGFLNAETWGYGGADSIGRIFLQPFNARGRWRGWEQFLPVGNRNGQVIYHYPRQVVQTLDGGFVIYGTRKVVGGASTLFLLKVDSLGEKIWENQTEPESVGVLTGTFFDTTADSGFILTGIVSYIDTAQEHKLWRTIRLVKCSPEGKTEWSRDYRAERDYATATCVRQTSNGGYVVLGSVGEFNATYTAYLDSLDDAFLLKTDNEGKVQWWKIWGGPERENLWFMLPLSDGSMLVTGNGGINEQLYLAKIKIGTLGIEETGAEEEQAGTFQVIPNPARDRLRVVYPASVKGGAIRLYDILGRYVLGRSVSVGSSGSVELDVSGLPAGAYRAVLEGKEGFVIENQSVMVAR